MNRLPGLFVDQQNVFVLIDDVELRRADREVGVFLLRRVEKFVVDVELDEIAFAQARVALGALAVDLDALEADIFLQQRRRQQRNRFGDEPVQALPDVIFADGKFLHIEYLLIKMERFASQRDFIMGRRRCKARQLADF